ncbi:hypothetical protein QQ045_006260 [Rhodiola kirilowii]
MLVLLGVLGFETWQHVVLVPQTGIRDCCVRDDTLSCLCLRISICHGSDSIYGNESLSGDQTILSAGGIFRMGFFKPGNSMKYYIGIWYNKVSTLTCVWVANRETGIPDRFSSHLKIVDGNLVLLNEAQTVIWSTNLSTSASSSVKAVLQDDGNLVLQDGSMEKLWQSFDYPTHTWLPGGKIRLDKRTNRSQLLTSWKNSDDPSPGLYSLELDPNGTNSYFILWNRSVPYWTSGTWNGQIFSLVPEMRLNYLYNFSYVSNENESYFTYSLYDSSIISRFVMDVSGQVKQLTWLSFTREWNLFWSQPRTQCEVYAFCGAFGTCNEGSTAFCSCLKGFDSRSKSDWNLKDYSGGCVRKTPLNCGNSSIVHGRIDKFMENPYMRSPIRAHSIFVNSSEECKRTCSYNCSCTAYSFDRGTCSVWFDDLLDLKQFPGTGSSPDGITLHVKLNAAELPDAKKNTGMIIGIVAGLVVVAVVIGLIFVIFTRRKRTTKMAKPVEGSLMSFGYRDLQNATKNFSDKLGGGGFGSVFKGTLPDSTVIAVKKLESFSQGEKQFRTEVSTIGTLQHVNLVRLRGFCSEGTKRLLVYEYMSNGSLEAHLFHNDRAILDWRTRYQIALGTARGLNYLHEKCRECIIHCDIKPENILLDSELCPKVADFGLAKLMGREFSRVLTTIRGTRGYLAPEWISGVAITAKADVYSYGMMLFEILSGKRNFEQHGDGKIKFFPTHAANKLNEGDLDVLSLVDHRLERIVDAEEVMKALKVACWCVQDDENDRPSMGQVVQILEGVVDVNLPPIPRSLQMFIEDQERLIFFTESSASKSSCPQSNTSTSTSQSKSIPSLTSSKSSKTLSQVP